MPQFKLRFPPDQIESLAERFSYADDAACRKAGASAQRRGAYTRSEFLTVCNWKTLRSASRVKANSETAIQDSTRVALTSPNEADRMDALVALEGVGVPTGSALLMFAFPDDYPILDVRALESLGVPGRSQYSVSFWVDYLQACRKLARENQVSIRTLDKALWQYSKELS